MDTNEFDDICIANDATQNILVYKLAELANRYNFNVELSFNEDHLLKCIVKDAFKKKDLYVEIVELFKSIVESDRSEYDKI